ncbi:MAG: CBS domain-containing protein [Bdellovibrionota bacterium]
MPLQNIVEKKMITCAPEFDVRRVAKLMAVENVGAVLVVENGIPVGMVTDRDLVLRCVSDDHDCSNVLVRDVMTPEVVKVRGDEGIQNVIDVMKEKEVRRVVVVDDRDTPVGMVSFGDLVGLLASELNALAQATSLEKVESIAKVA